MPGKLADVAKQAGVSEATVSRVLNGKPGISDATRAAVLTALDVIGYERPTNLRGRKARMAGLVVPELQNPIFPALADVVSGGSLSAGSTPCSARAPAACRRRSTCVHAISERMRASSARSPIASKAASA